MANLLVIHIRYAFERIQNHFRQIIEIRLLPVHLLEHIEEKHCHLTFEGGTAPPLSFGLDALSIVMLGFALRRFRRTKNFCPHRFHLD